MPDVPQQVRQKNEQRDRAADPEPRASKHTPMRGHEQAETHGGAEDQHRIFVFEAESGDDSEPDPELFVAGFDNAYQQPGAAYPEQRLESVHSQQIVPSENTGRD